MCVVGLTRVLLLFPQSCHAWAMVHRIIQDRLSNRNRDPGRLGAKLTEFTYTVSPENGDKQKYWDLLKVYEDESFHLIYRAARLAVVVIKVCVGLPCICKYSRYTAAGRYLDFIYGFRD
jgi:hypothetical protein